MGLFGRIISKITGTAHASPSDWADLEAALLEADLGPDLAGKILHSARTAKSESASQAIASTWRAALSESSRAMSSLHPSAVLVVGVNGTGKTTTSAKLAQEPVKNGQTVRLEADETFRAPPGRRLRTWGERPDNRCGEGSEKCGRGGVC